MDILLIIDVLLALATVGFGAAGWLAPNWTMDKVGLADTGSTMGLSEVLVNTLVCLFGKVNPGFYLIDISLKVRAISPTQVYLL
ncbi:MAG: hypothetical protein AAF264_14700, partial [Pseudomonadota bacterium]